MLSAFEFVQTLVENVYNFKIFFAFRGQRSPRTTYRSFETVWGTTGLTHRAKTRKGQPLGLSRRTVLTLVLSELHMTNAEIPRKGQATLITRQEPAFQNALYRFVSVSFDAGIPENNNINKTCGDVCMRQTDALAIMLRVFWYKLHERRRSERLPKPPLAVRAAGEAALCITRPRV